LLIGRNAKISGGGPESKKKKKEKGFPSRPLHVFR
jgi:hypothetical protein